MDASGGIEAKVRMMTAGERRLLEAEPAVLLQQQQRRRRRGPEDPGVGSRPPVEPLRVGPAVAELRGEDALDAEVRQSASVHESGLLSGTGPVPFKQVSSAVKGANGARLMVQLQTVQNNQLISDFSLFFCHI